MPAIHSWKLFPCTFSKISIVLNGKSEEINSRSISLVPEDVEETVVFSDMNKHIHEPGTEG